MSSSAFTPEQMALLVEENEQLREENKELRRMLFGSKRERFVPAVDDGQLNLELDGQPAEPVIAVKQTVSYQRAVKQASGKAIRGSFPAHLPRVDIILEPEEDVSGMRKIGEEITEELDLKSASLLVRRYIRPRYVSVEENFHIAPLLHVLSKKACPVPAFFQKLSVTNSCTIYLFIGRCSGMSS
jgi:hypothetical protein